jgi:pimeloyl-ACP methyl ester carboxylesterase
MGRGWKILIGIVLALALIVGVNAVVTDAETKPAALTVPGARIVHLPGGDLQVLDTGSRTGSPIVLIHCFTCGIDWWDGVIPRLAHGHRVIAVDLLGHDGSEKPSSGYSIENQADLVAEALGRLGVRDAVVAGHSLGGGVAVALAEQSPELVNRVVIIDTAPTNEGDSLGLSARLAFTPVIGEALWRIKPDFSVRSSLAIAFAPGFDVPDAFVEEVNRMTYTSYDGSHNGLDDFKAEEALDSRMRRTGKPLLVLMGAEEQIIDEPAARLAEYRTTVPGARTKLIAGSGHSPNVERPAETAALILAFAPPRSDAKTGSARHKMQNALQNPGDVRSRP